MSPCAEINAIVEESLNLAYHGARAEKQGFNITLQKSLDPAAGEFPLNHAILGGKQLYKGADSTAVLIRPDMTRFITNALDELDEAEIRPKFFALAGGTYTQPVDEKRFMEMWRMIQDLRIFFDAAAENLEAVVFTAKLQA